MKKSSKLTLKKNQIAEIQNAKSIKGGGGTNGQTVSPPVCKETSLEWEYGG